jgi:hypothetical protein
MMRFTGFLLPLVLGFFLLIPTGAHASNLPCKNGGSLTSEIKCLAPKLNANKAMALKVYNCETGPNAPTIAYIGAWQLLASEYRLFSRSGPGWVQDIYRTHPNVDHAGSGYGSTLAVLSWNKWNWSSCA